MPHSFVGWLCLILFLATLESARAEYRPGHEREHLTHAQINEGDGPLRYYIDSAGRVQLRYYTETDGIQRTYDNHVANVEGEAGARDRLADAEAAREAREASHCSRSLRRLLGRQ